MDSLAPHTGRNHELSGLEEVSGPNPAVRDVFQTLISSGSVQLAVLDFDQTLARTSALHLAMLTEVAKRFNATADIHSVYDALRGQSYTEILSAIGRFLGADQRADTSFSDCFYDFLEMRSPKVQELIQMHVQAIEGARELVTFLKAQVPSLLVCTGSPRPLVEAMLRSPMIDLAEDLGGCLRCHGDPGLEGLSKTDPEYWARSCGQVPRDKIIAFDDHPHSARAVLEIGHVAHLFFRPSCTPDKASSLLASHPGRIHLVPEWSGLL